jgi:hypothetical protein
MLRFDLAPSALLILFASSILGGCNPLDGYSLRAIQYNLEAEETQNQVILLNIARASLQRPMEFTEITNIVGGNSASGTTSFSFPVGFRLPTGVTTGSAGGTLTGTTTFTIPVLDTQDFYEGLLNDIQPSLVGYYLQSPFVPKDLILNLFIERITVDVTDGGCTQSNHSSACERDFRNNPDSREDIALFETFVSYLESLQLSVEQVPDTTTNSKAQIIVSGNTTININNGSNTSSGAGSPTDSSGTSTKTPKYRLCFSPRAANASQSAATCGYTPPQNISASKPKPGRAAAPVDHARAGAKLKPAPKPLAAESTQTKATAEEQAANIAPTTKLVGILFSQALAQDMENEVQQLGDQNHYLDSINAFSGRTVSITLQFRSTGSIFNFLGQLVNASRTGPAIALYQPVFQKQPQDWYPCWFAGPGPYTCLPIISVYDGGLMPLVSIPYDGSVYSVPSDPKVSYSPAVFTILKQLVALNLSGKNLPTTAILSVTSP